MLFLYRLDATDLKLSQFTWPPAWGRLCSLLGVWIQNIQCCRSGFHNIPPGFLNPLKPTYKNDLFLILTLETCSLHWIGGWELKQETQNTMNYTCWSLLLTYICLGSINLLFCTGIPEENVIRKGWIWWQMSLQWKIGSSIPLNRNICCGFAQWKLPIVKLLGLKCSWILIKNKEKKHWKRKS